MIDALNRHEKAALMFSGGKDSLACLYLLKPYWEKITVIWVNTGDMFPENEEIVRKFAAQVPNFLEVKTDARGFVAKNGLPSDIVPINNTDFGMKITGELPTKIISGYECCAHNIWMPGLNAARQTGATLIIRGQRNQEHAKSTVRSGDTLEGFEFLFPIQEWSQDEVLSYLKENGFNYPEFFNFAESSLDCMHCTAFLSSFTDRKIWMARNHPEACKQNSINIEKILSAVREQIVEIKESTVSSSSVGSVH